MKHIVIGRHGSCAVVIDNPRVSGRHAELQCDASGRVWITDLGSTNGTFVDGVVIGRQTPLKPGMLVYLADHAFDWQDAVRKHLTIESPGDTAVEPPKLDKPYLLDKRKVMPLLLLLGISAALLALVVTLGNDPVQVSEEGIEDEASADSTQTAQNPNQADTVQVMQPQTTRVDRDKTPVRKAPTWPPLYDPVQYIYACLAESDGVDELVLLGGDIQNAMVEIAGPEISIVDEIRIGEEVRNDLLAEYVVWTDRFASKRCQDIFDELVRTIDAPRGMPYELIMLDADELNAFTVGGKVFLLRGIYEFAESDDELAGVLAHEIQHNERGHINRKLKKHAMAEELFGDAAMIPLLADQVLLASFGQKDEAECDLHGVSHMVRLGYDGCAVAQFWSRFAENEDENSVDKLLRTHPYSSDRKKCIVAHINTNYGHHCSE